MNLSLKNKLAIIFILVVAAISSLSVLYFLNQQQKAKDTQLSVDIVAVVEVLDELAHQHAVERGLSAGYLGSQGANLEPLAQQRLKADESEQALLQLLNQQSQGRFSQEVKNLVKPVLKQLALKAKVREQVTKLAKDNNSFQYYSELNYQALFMIEELSLKIHDGDIIKQMGSLKHILWLKEKLGQVRGLLNGTYSRGHTTISQYALIKSSSSDIQRYINELPAFLEPEIGQKLESLLQTEAYLQSVEHIESFLQQSSSLSQVQGPDAKQWFSLATAVIKDIKSLAVLQSHNIHQLSEQKYHQAQWSMGLSSIASLISLLLIASLLLSVILRINNGVKGIRQQLQQLLDSKELNQDLNLKGADELNQIISQVNQFKEVLRELLSKASRTSQNLQSSSSSAEIASEESQKSLQQQGDETDAIAVAIEEMSQSAVNVAENAEQATEISQVVKQGGEKSCKESERLNSDVISLNKELESSRDLVQHLASEIADIHSTIEVISSISEQTNLLALNAAIESARAGEMGRGFAVVADEVRTLAARTQTATEDISSRIDGLKLISKEAVDKMQHSMEVTEQTAVDFKTSQDQLLQVFEEINRATMSITEIASAAEQQSAVSQEISRSIQRVLELSNQSQKAIQDSTKEHQEISRLAAELNQNVQLFKYE